jgi:hypothetical protein
MGEAADRRKVLGKEADWRVALGEEADWRVRQRIAVVLVTPIAIRMLRLWHASMGEGEGCDGKSARKVDVVVLGVDAMGTRGRGAAVVENPSTGLSTTSPRHTL